jgi:hypothetical protein
LERSPLVSEEALVTAKEKYFHPGYFESMALSSQPHDGSKSELLIAGERIS